MISLFMYLELFLVVVEFLILEGDNLEKLFLDFAFKVVGLKVGGKQEVLILTILVILPTTWLRRFGVASLCFSWWGFGFSDCGGLCFLGKCS